MRYLLVTVMILLHSMLQAPRGHATAVAVYAEGRYTDTHLIVDIFADIAADQAGGPLRSAGVRLTYPPSLLVNPSPEKNEAAWYFGLPGSTLAYRDPEISAAGEIVFLLGKLDQDRPFDGVAGERVLLGTVIFERRPDTAVPLPGDFALREGSGGPFVDFITTLGQVLDDAVLFKPLTVGAETRGRQMVPVIMLLLGGE